MRSLSILTCVAALLFACGNSNSKKPVEDPANGTTTAASDAQPQETPEEKFARQQTDTVNKMCQRLVDCSIEDAKAQMSPEEFEKLDVPKIMPAAIADCTQNADKSPLSPRQVIGIRECLGQPIECSVFSDCIGAAGKAEYRELWACSAAGCSAQDAIGAGLTSCLCFLRRESKMRAISAMASMSFSMQWV